MTAPYSVRFFSVAVTTESSDVYTVPPGYVAVLRDVQFYNSGASPLILCLITLNGPGLVGALAGVNNVAAGGWASWQGRSVANAGEVLGAFIAPAERVTINASGYLLTSAQAAQQGVG